MTPQRMHLTAIVAIAATLLAGCGKEDAKKEAAPRAPVDVTTVTVAPRDTPVSFSFVGQTQSSREVEIRARVDGFLEKRLYTEGALVQAGEPMFQMDRKPFEATLQSAKGQLAQQQAALQVAEETLARVKPLAEQNALSKKDLDDAVGNVEKSRAAVIAAQGQVQSAELNLGYTTIYSPLRGLSSFAKVQEGAYVSAPNSLLTTVSQIDPIWVNFSVSENETLRYREQEQQGRLLLPRDLGLEVEVVLADGSRFPQKGRISFADPSFSKDTGTFLVRAVLANPQGVLRPGQFVKVLVNGAVRPNATLVPRRAVQQGAKSHFVWVVGKDGQAEPRPVAVGAWNGDDWFIDNGLAAGEQVVVDGAIRITAGATLKASPYVAPKPAADGTARAAGPMSLERSKLGGAVAPKDAGAKSGGATATPQR